LEENISIKERFRCAGALLLRGLTAPVTRPILYATGFSIDEVKPGTFSLENTMRAQYDVRAQGEQSAAIIGFFLSAGFGIVAGALIAAVSVVEAPYQLIRASQPVSRPVFERKWGW
jgi:hypothetical protein